MVRFNFKGANMYYQIIGDSENFANFLPSNYTQKLADKFNGRVLSKGWEVLHFDLVDKKDGRPIPEIITGYIPICSRRIYERIKEDCKGCVEFLPCTVGDKNMEYFLFNILVTKDTIDYDKSIYKRFPSTGRIMLFNKIVFTSKVETPLFRISDLPYTYFFCTEEFKQLLESTNAKGIIFSNDMF